jgi:alcohol dehydrogenase class IV
MRFEFATSNRIIFGAGILPEAASGAASFGRRALVVTGRNQDRASKLLELLASQGVHPTLCAIPSEPTIAEVLQGAMQARRDETEVVIGFGGGAALDGAKAIAALLTNPGDPFEYLEVIGRGAALRHPAAPCIAIPTTAGTGSEVTRNAVLASPEHRVKVSLRSPHLLPRLAVVDPELTAELPPAITATTGLDALTQLIEPYLSGRANPLTDALCVDGIRRVAGALRRAVDDGRDVSARRDMALASLYGGLALANAGLGAVHGFAGPIGGMFSAPHGAVCAALLPHVVEMNLRALQARAPGSAPLQRLGEIGRLLTGQPQAGAPEAIRWLRELVSSLLIPPLASYGISRTDVAAIVTAAEKASSMKANAIPLTHAELTRCLEAAL